jgi:hypothetical protein
MFPLALIPIGLFALIATVCTESPDDKQAETSIEKGQMVTLMESFIPFTIQKIVQYKLPPTPTFDSSAGLTDPVLRATTIKAVGVEAEKSQQQSIQTSTPANNLKVAEDAPGQYLPKAETDDDDRYSAPLGLKDESHDDWMK